MEKIRPFSKILSLYLIYLILYILFAINKNGRIFSKSSSNQLYASLAVQNLDLRGKYIVLQEILIVDLNVIWQKFILFKKDYNKF